MHVTRGKILTSQINTIGVFASGQTMREVPVSCDLEEMLDLKLLPGQLTFGKLLGKIKSVFFRCEKAIN